MVDGEGQQADGGEVECPVGGDVPQRIHDVDSPCESAPVGRGVEVNTESNQIPAERVGPVEKPFTGPHHHAAHYVMSTSFDQFVASTS
ncbi:hypothetical protein GCM10020221_10940 [Streptomyces thioluteus]|uniref:Uncharacterized protein n=1 Tax=Streptomyces thioluteus TaxID=66431 RepID=A0ABN3WK90_STRTU